MTSKTVSLVGMLAFAHFAFAAGVTTIEPGQTLTVTDANVGDYADGITFADATGVVEFNTSSAPTMVITGAGTVKKTSSSNWTMTKELPNFYGTYVLEGSGIVTVNENKNSFFGSMATGSQERGPLIIRDGTTLDIVNNDSWNKLFEMKAVHIAGTGKGGAGAIRTLHTTKTMTGDFRWLVLDDDAMLNLVTGSDSWFILNAADGYIRSADDVQKTLTLSGAGSLQIVPSFVLASNVAVRVTGTGRFVVRDETVAHTKIACEPSVTDPITLEGSGIFQLYNLIYGTEPDFSERATVAVDRPLVVKSASAQVMLNSRYTTDRIEARTDRTDDGVNNIRGDVTLEAGSKLTTIVEWFEQLQLSGRLLGSGELAITSGNGSRGRVYISSTNDAFTGKVTMGNSTYHPALLLGAPGTLPDYTKLTVGSGYVGVDLRHWDVDSVKTLAAQVNFSGLNAGSIAYIGLDTTFWGGTPMPFCYPGSDTALPVGGCTAGVIHLTNVVTTAADPLRVTHAGGTMLVKDEGRPIYIGDSTRVAYPIEVERTEPATLQFRDADLRMGTTSPQIGFIAQDDRDLFFTVPKIVLSNSTFVAENRRSDYSDMGTDALLAAGTGIGSLPHGGGALEILDGSVVSSKLVVAGSTYYGKGAVYQRGGSVTALGSATSWDNSSCVGSFQSLPWIENNTHGYYELSGGTFTALGRFSLGPGCGASWFQSGGYATFGKALGSDEQPLFQIGSTRDSTTSPSSTLEMYVSGGTFDVGPDMEAGSNKEVAFSGYGTRKKRLQVTVDGSGALLDFRNKHLMGTVYDDSRSCFNIVNGGTLRANSINRGHADSVSGVNFNGGTFRVYGESVDIFHRHGTWPDAGYVLVHEKGATIETTGPDVRASMPIQGLSGQGVTAITMSAPITGICFPPQVVIDGDGVGASAVCVYDSKTSTISSIKVLCSGSGYTSATAYLQWGNSMTVTKANNKDFALTCTLGNVVNTGSFTKAGEGYLDLSATNTWGGATIVKGGILKVCCDWAIPTNTAVKLAGGDLDLNHKVAKISSVEYGAGGGRILNAENAEIPGTASLAIDIADLVAGKSVALTGDVDLSDLAITITGDVSLLEEGAKYVLATTTGGTFIGKPTYTLGDEPVNWGLANRGTKLVYRYVHGMLMLVR